MTIGDSMISPGDKHGLFPLAIPLSRNSSGIVVFIKNSILGGKHFSGKVISHFPLLGL